MGTRGIFISFISQQTLSFDVHIFVCYYWIWINISKPRRKFVPYFGPDQTTKPPITTTTQEPPPPSLRTIRGKYRISKINLTIELMLPYRVDRARAPCRPQRARYRPFVAPTPGIVLFIDGKTVNMILFRHLITWIDVRHSS